MTASSARALVLLLSVGAGTASSQTELSGCMLVLGHTRLSARCGP